MQKGTLRKVLVLVVVSLMLLSGCAQAPEIVEKQVVVEKPVVQTVVVEKPVEKVVLETVVVEKQVVAPTEPAAPAPVAKYVFLFIGDGMGVAQRNAAELFKGATTSTGARPESTKLLMNTLPAQGMNTTYDLTSVIPDSASTATAMASGNKTASGVVGMDPTGSTAYRNLSEIAKAAGMKVGIISSVSIDHATPAAFYAHQLKRGDYYEISVQLAESDFDLFAGGPPKRPTGPDKDQKDVIEIAEENGFSIVVGKQAWEQASAADGKIWAMPQYYSNSNSTYYEMDRPENEVGIAGYVSKAVEILDNPNGFFLMVEGGKIDWACHANDAAAAIRDTIAFDASIQAAYDFYMEHPDETLIVVTGDHETGGMTIGFAGTKYGSFVDKIAAQELSQVAFDIELKAFKDENSVETAELEDILPTIEKAYGLKVLSDDERAALEEKAGSDPKAAAELALALSDLELATLEEAFAESMLDKEVRTADEYTYLLYGGYEPLSIKCSTILNQKAGIAWTSYSHTGVPVQTSAIGVGCEQFNGYYDQTNIFDYIVDAAQF